MKGKYTNLKDPYNHHEFPTTHGKIKKIFWPPKKPGYFTINKPLKNVGFGVQKRQPGKAGIPRSPSAFLRCQAVDPMTGASMTRTYGLMTPFDTKMQDPVVVVEHVDLLTGSDCVFIGFFFVKVNYIVGLIRSYMHHIYIYISSLDR